MPTCMDPTCDCNRKHWRRGHGPPGSGQDARFQSAQERTRQRLTRKLVLTFPRAQVQWKGPAPRQTIRGLDTRWEHLVIDGVTAEVRVCDGCIYMRRMPSEPYRFQGDVQFSVRKCGIEVARTVRHRVVDREKIVADFKRQNEERAVHAKAAAEERAREEAAKKARHEAAKTAYGVLLDNPETGRVTDSRIYVRESGSADLTIELYCSNPEQAKKFLDTAVAAGLIRRYPARKAG